jgi:fatty acid synthase
MKAEQRALKVLCSNTKSTFAMNSCYCASGMAIQWGAIGDVGVAYDLLGGNQDVAIGGTLPQRIGSCLSTLDSLLCQPEAVVSSFVLAETVRGKSDGAASGVSLREAVAHILGE